MTELEQEGDDEVTVVQEKNESLRKRKDVNADCNFDVT